MFEEYLYFTSYSDHFMAHAERMAATLTERFGLGPERRVLEVASNDGYLLKFFRARGIAVLGVEPARNIAAVAQGRGIPTLNRFFGPDVVAEIVSDFGRADVLVGNNVLAHVPAINDFLAAVGACLAPGGRGRLRISVPGRDARSHRVRHRLSRARLLLLARRHLPAWPSAPGSRSSTWSRSPCTAAPFVCSCSTAAPGPSRPRWPACTPTSAPPA